MAYERLHVADRDRPVVHIDDAGRRLRSESAFLMVFEADEATVSRVGPRQRLIHRELNLPITGI